MTGKPVGRDLVLRSIMSGAKLTAFANIGAFKENHLRVLVTMRTPLNVIKMVAKEPGTNPAEAIDYCSSAAIAKVLINICRNVTCFSFYNQDTFVEGEPLHDYRKGADRFRSREVVYEVLCERVLFGGDVLPAHVARWFNNYGPNSHYTYMLKRGLDHMMACYEIYEKQAFEATEELITPLPYQFMVAYHRYTKYLPLKVFFRAVLSKKKADQKKMNDELEKGSSIEQVQASFVAEQYRKMASSKSSAESRKKKRRFARAAKRGAIKDLWVLSDKIVRLECCEKLILSFL